jgi:hypothetical protein
LDPGKLNIGLRDRIFYREWDIGLLGFENLKPSFFFDMVTGLPLTRVLSRFAGH